MSKYNVNGNETEKKDYEIKVLKAKVIKPGRVNFNLLVNGVCIYGMVLIEYTNKAGESGTMIDFPSWKSETVKNDDGSNKYIPYVTFPVTKEIKAEIIEQIDKILL